jgi:DNA mismatch repair ATPase MutL
MQVKKAARATIVSTQSQPSIRDNMVAVFGAKLAAALEPVKATDGTFTIHGFISSAVKTGGKTNGHPQFFFVNNRPVDLPKAVRVVNEVYKCAPQAPAVGLLQWGAPVLSPVRCGNSAASPQRLPCPE